MFPKKKEGETQEGSTEITEKRVLLLVDPSFHAIGEPLSDLSVETAEGRKREPPRKNFMRENNLLFQNTTERTKI